MFWLRGNRGAEADNSQAVSDYGSRCQPAAEGGKGILGFVARCVAWLSGVDSECDADDVYSDDCVANANRGDHRCLLW